MARPLPEELRTVYVPQQWKQEKLEIGKMDILSVVVGFGIIFLLFVIAGVV